MPERDFRDMQSRPTSPNPIVELWKKLGRYLDSFRPTNLTELALVTRQFATLMKAGTGIVRALDVVCGQGLSGRVESAWFDVSQQVARGVSLSRAMARHPQVFDGLYRGLIKSGESSGSLVR